MKTEQEIEQLFKDAIVEWCTVKGKRLQTRGFVDSHRDPGAGCALTALALKGKDTTGLSVHSEDISQGVRAQVGHETDAEWFSQNAFYRGFDTDPEVSHIALDGFTMPQHISAFTLGARVRSWAIEQGYL